MFQYMKEDSRQNSLYSAANAERLIAEGVEKIKQIQNQKTISKDELTRCKSLSSYADIINHYL